MAEAKDPKAGLTEGLGLEAGQYEALEQEFQEVGAGTSEKSKPPIGGLVTRDEWLNGTIAVSGRRWRGPGGYSTGARARRHAAPRAPQRARRGGAPRPWAAAGAAAAPRPPPPPPPPPQVLTELAGDRSLERFRLEYEKLYRTLKKSHGAHRCAVAGAMLLRRSLAAQRAPGV